MDIKIKNYQAARDISLEVEGLTVLKGRSNAGKSSTLKALYSAIHNRFRVDCVTWGEDSCDVEVKFSGEKNILKVHRSYKGGSPKVQLGNEKNGYKEYQKLNKDVPREVVDYINFGYIQVPNQEKFPLNFCTQFSPPFMVSFSSKKIVDILSYNKATADLSAATKKLANRKTFIKGEVSGIASSLSTINSHIGNLHTKLLAFKNKQEVSDNLISYKNAQECIQSLQKLKDKIQARQQINIRNQAASQLLSQLKAYKVGQDKSEQLSRVRSVKQSLSNILLIQGKAQEILTVLKSFDSRLEQLSRVLSVKQFLSNILLIQGKAQEVLTVLKSFDSRLEQFSKLSTLLKNKGIEKLTKIKQISESLTVLSKESLKSTQLSSLKQSLELIPQLTEAVAQAKSALDNMECPFCGAHINKQETNL